MFNWYIPKELKTIGKVIRIAGWVIFAVGLAALAMGILGVIPIA